MLVCMKFSPSVGIQRRKVRYTFRISRLKESMTIFRPMCNLLIIVGICFSGSYLAAEDRIDFDRQIRPILSQHCFHCHGPDDEHREAGLRLDDGPSAKAELDSGTTAIVSGKPEESELIERIFTIDDDLVMPPKDANRDLNDNQKQLLKRWIAEGAEFTEHWAFVAPERPTLPEVTNKKWSKNAIDHFILAKLEKASLQPSPPADKRTLIRRVTLDLTGLPPTPEEVEAFLTDDKPDAYGRVVDRLLKSPHYGERMAWPWLDAARYADTAGYQGDPTRPQWPWRDWLVTALNDNKPFNRFTIELLAGDRLPNATPEQILATAFNRNHMHNGEGGRIAEETRVENVFDRTETTATVWMGLTFTCARCHDHKFDPISIDEYFSLYDFFNQTSENGAASQQNSAITPSIAYSPPTMHHRLAKLKAEIAAARKATLASDVELDKAQLVWEKSVVTGVESLALSPWHVLGPLLPPEGNADKMFAHLYPPEKNVDLNAEINGKKWTVREEFVDGKVHELDSAIAVTYLYRTVKTSIARQVNVSLGSDDSIKLWVNGKQVHANPATRAAAADQGFAKLPLVAGENQILMKIVNTGGISGFYFRITDSAVQKLLPVLTKRPDQRSEQEQAAVREHFRRNISPTGAKHFQRLDDLTAELKSLDTKTIRVMTMDTIDNPRTTFVLDKGAYDKPTDRKVTAAVPKVLPPLPEGTQPDRLALAKWLVSGEHPLTARVTVNRYWQMFFGRGIVATPEDFGAQGKRPTHPLLLDWLAREFVESGWDVKHIHKLIVTSATYQQSSRVTPELLQADPTNKLLARSPRYRLPSWMLRDQALAASGSLISELGGPPVKPYQPAGVWADATFNTIRYTRDSGNALYRRSLYIFWRRIVGPTMFFDAAKRQTCEVKPNLTNTPLHTLVTLNETGYIEAARALAELTMTEEKATEQRISFAFQRLTARTPNSEESAILTSRYDQLLAHYSANEKERNALLTVGESRPDSSANPTELAAMTAICNIIMNLDEVLTRQ